MLLSLCNPPTKIMSSPSFLFPPIYPQSWERRFRGINVIIKRHSSSVKKEEIPVSSPGAGNGFKGEGESWRNKKVGNFANSPSSSSTSLWFQLLEMEKGEVSKWAQNAFSALLPPLQLPLPPSLYYLMLKIPKFAASLSQPRFLNLPLLLLLLPSTSFQPPALFILLNFFSEVP